MAVNIGPRIGIDGEAEYRKAIQNIIQETKTLKSEFEKISSDTGTNSFKKAIEQSKVLTQEIEAQQKRVQELQKGYEEATSKWGADDTKTLKWKQAVNEATTELNKLKAELDKIPNAAEIVGQKFQDWGKNLQSVGSEIKNVGYAFSPVSAAAAAGLTASAKSFMDFESSMSNVKAISGATGQEFDDLTEKAKEMGAKTKFSAVESADAFSYMAMAGWKAEDMLDGIEGVMNLAAAGGEDLALTSDIVTDAITAFGLSAKDSSHFADVMAAAAANSNTNVSMLGESFKYIAPVAGALNYSIDDTAVALGLMANAGIKSSMSGRALRNVLTNMANPSDTMASAMSRLGVNLYDTSGNMLTLRELMDSLRSAFGDVVSDSSVFDEVMQEANKSLAEGVITEEEYNDKLFETAMDWLEVADAEKAELAAQLAGKQGMAGLLAIIGTSQEEYDKLTKAIDNSAGAAQEMADIMLDNAEGAWVIAKSALEGAAIEAGAVLAPYLVKAANAVKELANWFSNLSQPQQDMIVKTMAITAAIAPLLIGTGKVVGSIGTIVEKGGSLISWMGELSKKGGFIKSAIPAISTALGGVSTFITGTLVPGIASLAAGISSAIAAALPVIAVIAAVVAAGVLLYKNWDTIKEKAGELGQTVSNKWNEIKDKTHEAWENVKEKTSEAWESVKNSISDKINNAKDTVEQVGENIKNTLHDKWEETKSKTSEAWNNIKDTVSEHINNAKDTVEEVGENIKNTLSEKWENVKEKTSEAWENVQNAVSEKISSAHDTVKEVAENIKNDLSGKWENVKEATHEAWENIKTAVSEAIGNVLNNVREKMSAIKDAVTEKVQFIKDKIGEVIDFIKELPSKAFEWGKDLISNMTDGIKENFNKVKDKASNVAQIVKNFLGFSEPKEGPLSDFHTYAPDMMELYAKGINDNSGLVTNAVDKVADGIHYSISAIGKALQDSGVQWEKYTKDVRLAHDPVRTLIDFAEESLWAHLNTAEGIAKAQKWMRDEYKMTAEDAELTTATIKKTLDEQGINWNSFSGQLSEAFANASSNAKQALLDSGVDWERYKETVWNSKASVEECVLNLTEELEYNFDRVGGDIDILRSDMIGFFNSEYDIDLDDATRAVDAFVEVVSNGTNSASENLQNIANASGDMSNQIVLNVSGIASAAQDMSSAVVAAGEATSQAMISVSGTVKEANREITVSHDETRDSTVKTLEEMVDIAAEQYKTMNNSTTQTVKAMKEYIQQTNVAIHENTTSEMGMTRDEAINKVKELRERVSDEMSKTKDKMTDEARATNEGVKNEFQNLVDSSKGWGSDIGENLSSGLRGVFDKIKDAASGAAGAIASFLHFSEPDKGPLSNFHTFAPDMMELFAKGIKDNTHLITDQIAKSFDFQDAITTGYGYIPDYGNTTNNSVNIGDTVINVYGAQGQDEEELAEIIDGKLNDRYMRLQLAWG